jgi:parallel beta-helix repeat protein
MFLRLRLLFASVGQALCNKGLKALAGAVPFGEALWDIAADAVAVLREKRQQEEIRLALQEAARATPEEVQQELAAVVPELHPAEEVQIQLTTYLSQLPALVRRSLRRPADPAGLTVPPGPVLTKPEQVLAILPARMPRYRAGERPAGIGNWELEELLGLGGFGEVWKARHPRLKGIPAVALKFCLDPSASQVLRHEAALLDQVMQHGTHPGIVPLRQAYLDAEPLCLEYEYVAGGDLGGLALELRGLPDRQRVERVNRVVLGLAEVVGHAHRLSPPIVHRDLKPANVLVRRWDGVACELRVTDFGIGAVAAGQTLARERRGGTSRGDLLATVLRGSHTPLYASPQQARGEAADPRDDVHALGVIWFQLLTDDLAAGPPAGMDWIDDLKAAGLSDAQVRLLGSCVSPRAERRLADAHQLAQQLADTLRSAPRPPTPVSIPVPPVPVAAAVPIPSLELPPRQAPRPAVAPRPSAAPTLIVCARGTGDHRSIGAALRAAAPGGVVKVRPGHYAEGLTLSKRVEIVGDGPREQIVVESDDADVILMDADEAVVRGLTLRGAAGRKNKRYFAVDVARGRLILEDCDVTNDSLANVAIHGSGVSAVLRRCRVHDSAQAGVYWHDKAAGTMEDCDVFGNTYANVEVKSGARPTLRNCKVRDGKASGLNFHTGGLGVVENCEIFGNAKAGVQIKDGSDPTLRQCKVRDGQGAGIFITEKARGTIEGCDVFGNKGAALEVLKESNPTVRRCRVNDLFVYEKATGTYEELDVSCKTTGACVEVKEGANPLMRRCKIHDGISSGVYVNESGQGTFEDCEIFNNTLSGVQFREGSNAIARRCTVRNNQQNGFLVNDKAAGLIEDCEVIDNGRAGIEARAGANPTVRRCRVNRNGYEAVWVHEGGSATVEDCDLTGNKRGAFDVAAGCNVTRRGNRE